VSHDCQRCGEYRWTRAARKKELVQLVRQMADYPDGQRARTAPKRIAAIKEAMAASEQRHLEHLASVPDEPNVPRKILDVRRPKAKPAPKAKKRILIDASAVAAALAQTAELPETGRGTNVLPATGHCHECDRPISGERRFCGRCMAKRAV
jgi:hypothetical protein